MTPTVAVGVRPDHRGTAEKGQVTQMERFLFVCLGSGVGGGLRYLVGLWAGRRLGASFPYGTLFVNLAGCFLLSLIMHVALNLATFPVNLRFALTTGFMGGLTTYSTFNYETSKLFEDGSTSTAITNVGVTVLGCFAAGLLGLVIARRLVGG
jgi:CrcB protein